MEKTKSLPIYCLFLAKIHIIFTKRIMNKRFHKAPNNRSKHANANILREFDPYRSLTRDQSIIYKCCLRLKDEAKLKGMVSDCPKILIKRIDDEVVQRVMIWRHSACCGVPDLKASYPDCANTTVINIRRKIRIRTA